ncbi:MAG: DUF4317 domain-containing protein [Faecousia sp.]
MNTKEIGEIRRRVRRDRSNMTAIYGCYVNDNREIVSEFRQSTGMMSENEADKYFGLLKRCLSGTIGKNLIDICFKTSQVADSEEHRLLMELRKSSLQDEGQRMAFYQKVLDSMPLEGSYLILIGCDRYDVPFKSKDGDTQQDSSDETYTYLLCAICPVKQTKPTLHYVPENREFHDGGITNVVSAPELGFLFPAFDNRATNIYNALYYTHSPKESHEGFVDAVFRTGIPKPAFQQKKSFEALLSTALDDECSLDVVQTVHDQLCQRIELHKESRVPEALMISKEEVKEVLSSCGVSDAHMAKFSVDYDEVFGFEADLHPKNIIDNRHFEIKTPDVSIQVAPDRSDLIETRVIGGVKYILINAEENVEVNGVSIHIHDQEPATV